MTGTAKYIAILAAVVVLVLNQGRIDSLQEEGEFNRMAGTDVPPTLAVTTFALGPLRALVVDSLWWRAIQQQNNGEYYDAMQLSDWITQLQPTYSSVWAYQGWNMAFNILADFNDPEVKWQWVQRSIRLMRDEGLRYNPDDTLIKQELGRIFYDKIGGVNDAASPYYRRQWAFEMMKYFDTGNRRELEALVAIPKTEEELRKLPEVELYIQEAKRAGIDVMDFKKRPPKPGSVFRGSGLRPALRIYGYYRRQRIEQELKLDCDRMLFIDTEYGPFDWRAHHAHTVYWTVGETFDDFMKTAVNHSHIVRQTMMQSFRGEGRLLHIKDRDAIVWTNNIEIIDKIHDVIDYMMSNHYNKKIDNDHKEFLELAVTILYNYNRIDEARDAFYHYKIDYLKKDDPMTFEQFVLGSVRDTMKSIGVLEARGLVESTLYSSLMWADYGEFDRSNGTLARARLMWKEHQKLHAANEGRMLPPFDELTAAARARYVKENKVDAAKLNKKTAEARKKTIAELLSIGGVKKHVRPKEAPESEKRGGQPNDPNKR
jgi:hypothetical protein